MILSHTTKMTDIPLDLWRPTIKSIEMDFQALSRMESGCNNRASICNEGLFLQTFLDPYFNFFIWPFLVKLFFNPLYKIVSWVAFIIVLWKWCKILSYCWIKSNNHLSLSLKKKILKSVMIVCSWCNWNLSIIFCNLGSCFHEPSASISNL